MAPALLTATVLSALALGRAITINPAPGNLLYVWTGVSNTLHCMVSYTLRPAALHCSSSTPRCELVSRG